MFTHIEINEMLSKLVPQKSWDSVYCANMNFYQKIDHSKPSLLLQNQCIIQALDQTNHILPNGFDKPMNHLWTIDGEKVDSFMQLHEDTLVLIASHSDQF